MTNHIKYSLAAAILLIFVLLIPLSNILRAKNHLVNANDFSIYQQAIYDIGAGLSANPFLTIRNAHIFNDHVDPIIFLAAGFVKLFTFSATSLFIFEWLWFVLLLLSVIFVLHRHGRSPPFILFALATFIFSRSLLQGLEFPIHPTTWSMLPLFWLTYFIHEKKNFPAIALLSALLCLYRESFPFAIVSMSFSFLLHKGGWKKFLILFAIGGFFSFLSSYARPLLLGPIIDYGHGLMSELIKNPFSLLWSRLQTFQFPVKEFIAPLLLLGLYLWHEGKAKKLGLTHPIIAIMLLVSPLFFLHLLANYLVHHHSIIMVTPLLTLAILGWGRTEYPNIKVLLAILILFIATASSRYTKMVKVTHAALFQQEDAFYHSAKNLYSIIDTIPPQKTIIASGGLVPAILSPGRQVYQFVEVTEVLPTFDYLLLEKENHGDINPLTREEVREREEACEPHATSIIYEDKYFVLMQGPFTDHCLKIREKWPTPSLLLPHRVFQNRK